MPKQPLTLKKIVADLRKLGLKSGDIVIVHSSLSSIGQVNGGGPTIVQAFLQVLGREGTLVAPVFGKLGVITDCVRAHPEAVCSKLPVGTIAAIGAHAKDICCGHENASTAHGKGTPYTRIAELGGWICLLGVDQDRNTTMHTVEALLELPYLTDRKVSCETSDGQTTRTLKYYPGPHRDFISLDSLLRSTGAMHTGKVGRAVTRLIRSQTMIDTLVELGRKNPAFALCENPNCTDCVRQHAAIRRSLWQRESFTLAASAQLCGRYVDEIIENCAAAGIDHVELDMLQGKPVDMQAADIIQDAVKRLQEHGIQVIALRTGRISQSYPTLFESARACGIKRIVLPLQTDLSAIVKEARQAGLGLAFYNVGQDAVTASNQLLALPKTTSPVGFVFDAAGFARIGESPFLRSYKHKLRRYLCQLDVGDALYSGQSTPLGLGNAEIKEMISILRCASFQGYLVLSARNRACGTLLDTTRRLVCLLEAM